MVSYRLTSDAVAASRTGESDRGRRHRQRERTRVSAVAVERKF